MRKIFFLLCLSLLACQQETKTVKVEPEIDPSVLISCDGVGEVKLHFTQDDLEKKFGAGALVEHDNSVRGRYLTLWEGDPKQLNLYWKEKTPPFNTLHFIEIADPNAPYLTIDSLRIGASLRDVVQINGGMPVTFSNFELQDDNGLIKSFNGGTIEKSNPCLSGNLEVVARRNINVEEHSKFNQKKEVESFDNILERMDISLATIRVYRK